MVSGKKPTTVVHESVPTFVPTAPAAYPMKLNGTTGISR